MLHLSYDRRTLKYLCLFSRNFVVNNFLFHIWDYFKLFSFLLIHVFSPFCWRLIGNQNRFWKLDRRVHENMNFSLYLFSSDLKYCLSQRSPHSHNSFKQFGFSQVQLCTDYTATTQHSFWCHNKLIRWFWILLQLKSTYSLALMYKTVKRMSE